MLDLDCLGGALENFYIDNKDNPQFIKQSITVIENGEILATGTAEEIRDKLKDIYDKRIIKWESYFNIVRLTV